MGEWILDFNRRKQGMKVDLCLNNALINMYAKWGDIINVRKLFDNTRNEDTKTRTSTFLRNDKGKYNSSKFIVSPNDVTFIGVLMSCSHAG